MVTVTPAARRPCQGCFPTERIHGPDRRKPACPDPGNDPFAKDEGLRFVNLRLERNGQALDKLQNCQGIPGLIGVQQEWLRDLVQDYIGQNMRMAGALRGLTQNVMACASEQAAESMDRPSCSQRHGTQDGAADEPCRAGR